MLFPTFLARNRMVTFVLAKTTKVKNNFINGKKKFKGILSCLFGGRRKVRVTNLPSSTSAQHLSSQHFVAVPTPNIADLVPSAFFPFFVFFFSDQQPWFLRPSEHQFFQEKHQHFHVDI